MIEDDKQATQQEEQRENGGIKPVGQTMEDVLINYSDNMEEEAKKPKRTGVNHYFALIYSILLHLFKLL